MVTATGHGSIPVLGDDYMFPGVARAVAEIAAEGRWKADVSGNKFTFRL